jgi:transcriptional regulator with XRE-family HTH domain
MRTVRAVEQALADERADMLGVKLARFCINKGISAQDLAKAFGVTRSTVYAWFLGKYEPTSVHVAKIREMLKA